MIYSFRPIVFVLLIGSAVHSAEPSRVLAGDLPKVVRAEDSPYRVVADIFVPAGKVVTIEAGTVFLFTNFSGMHLQGILVANGTADRPVVFTSEHDLQYNPDSKLDPTPYDWNGIYIHRDGIGTNMKHFKVMYSVKGIVSETKYIRLREAVFNENGRSNCIIEYQEQPVVPNQPFSHLLSTKDATVDGVPIQILHDPAALKRTIVRYSGLMLSVGGVVLVGIFGREYHNASAALKDLSRRDVTNLTEHDRRDWEAARKRRNVDLTVTAIATLLISAGGVGFAWTFTF